MTRMGKKESQVARVTKSGTVCVSNLEICPGLSLRNCHKMHERDCSVEMGL